MAEKPVTEGGVWGSYVEYLDVLEADNSELRKQRDEFMAERDSAREQLDLLQFAAEREVEALRSERDAARANLKLWRFAFGEKALQERGERLADAVSRSQRPWTDDVVHEDGSKTVAVKRACNGCGELLGDVTEEEIDRAIAGLPAEDVRGECFTCTPPRAPSLAEENVKLLADNGRLSDEVARLNAVIVKLTNQERIERLGEEFYREAPQHFGEMEQRTAYSPCEVGPGDSVDCARTDVEHRAIHHGGAGS